MPDDGLTIAIKHCKVCPPIPSWQRKHMILGTCPQCGKHHPEAWRLAAALRLLEDRRAVSHRYTAPSHREDKDT